MTDLILTYKEITTSNCNTKKFLKPYYISCFFALSFRNLPSVVKMKLILRRSRKSRPRHFMEIAFCLLIVVMTFALYRQRNIYLIAMSAHKEEQDKRKVVQKEILSSKKPNAMEHPLTTTVKWYLVPPDMKYRKHESLVAIKSAYFHPLENKVILTVSALVALLIKKKRWEYEFLCH